MKNIDKIKHLELKYKDYVIKFISLGITASTGQEVFGYSSNELIRIQENGLVVWKLYIKNISNIYCDCKLPYNNEKFLTVKLTDGSKRYFRSTGDEITPHQMIVFDSMYKKYLLSEIEGAFFTKGFADIPTKYCEFLNIGYYEVEIITDNTQRNSIEVFDEYGKLKKRTNKSNITYKICQNESGLHRICSYDDFSIISVNINEIERCQVTYFLGDSTLANSRNLPRFGWAQLYSDDNVSINLAECGRSLESFIFEGKLNYCLNVVKEGDRVVIGFGHNDEKKTFFGSSPKEYVNLLNYYIEQIKLKNAIPIVCTPIPRNKWKGSLIENTHLGYDTAILNSIFNVQVIDLSSELSKIFNSLGEENATKYYLHNLEMHLLDNTHLSYAGALEIASYVEKKLN